jgi:hypothetical protein
LLNGLIELDDVMMDYYGNTLVMAEEELASYTDQMDHSASVLDHYATMLSILGKEQDYDAMGVVLEGQATMAGNRYEVSKKNYEML